MRTHLLRATCASLLPFLFALASAERFELKFTFAGNAAGGEVVETQKDGSFLSNGTPGGGALEIESKLTGKIVNGVLTEFELREKAGPTEYSMTTKGDKVSVVVKGK